MSTARPSLSPTNSIDTTSFLSHRNHRLVRRTLSLRCGVRFLRRASNNHMMRVREAAAEQLEERQSDWAYSRPMVILDLVWNFAFLVGATVVFEVSKEEAPGMPLRLWIFGYAVQCMIHMVCVSFEYNRRRRQHIIGLDDNVNLQHCGGGGGGGGGGWWRRLNSNSSMESDERDSRDYIPESSPQVEDETRRRMRQQVFGSGDNLNLRRGSGGGSWWRRMNSNSSSESDEGDSRDYIPERPQQIEDQTSVAKHLESANTMFSFIWWIIGFYWVSAGGESLTEDSPQLYWLCITFLAFDVFFVVICVAVACIIGIAVCCCLPCIIALLYAVADQEGATKEEIERLPKYRFRKIGEFEKQNGEIQESFGGIMTECDSATPIEHVLSLEDAECCICLCAYDDGTELRELPCRHHFHCSCIDKWLHINATCPLCKFNILKNGDQSGSEEV